MWKAVVLASMLLAVAFVAFGQHGKTQIGGKTASKSNSKPKPKPSPKPTPNPKELDKSWYSPCGVYYKNLDDLIADMDKGWRLIAETNDDYLWHDSDKVACDPSTKILKAWVKSIHRSQKEKADYSLILYELKCETNQLRLKSSADYMNSGSLLRNDDYDITWSDVIPDSVGEVILRTICRRL